MVKVEAEKVRVNTRSNVKLDHVSEELLIREILDFLMIDGEHLAENL